MSVSPLYSLILLSLLFLPGLFFSLSFSSIIYFCPLFSHFVLDLPYFLIFVSNLFPLVLHSLFSISISSCLVFSHLCLLFLFGVILPYWKAFLSVSPSTQSEICDLWNKPMLVQVCGVWRDCEERSQALERAGDGFPFISARLIVLLFDGTV